MPAFYALVDAMPGHEEEVKRGLDGLPRVLAVARAKDRSFDWLIKFEAPSFDRVDDFLQTYVRPLKGVVGIEIISDWDDMSEVVREARKTLE
ncbi:MAG: hypothetical protein ACYDCK_12465 [Thermoplasmatota archaeon]